MISNKQNPDFLHLGNRLLDWFRIHGRNLPFRETKDPYKIWISEIVFQQTRINQGLGHYIKFVERFPTVEILANAENDEVLVYWKGLGYYSRAINLHKAAKQIMEEFSGVFPNNFDAILSLKGVGKYTASAIASICFNERKPAVDGNFYRVLSRLFGDDFDISLPKAFDYFTELALMMAPENMGDFNQAMMDLGSEICKPRNPNCQECPLNKDCVAFSTNSVHQFPKKSKKVKVTEMNLEFYFVHFRDHFIAKKRGTDEIWKNLYEFPSVLDDGFKPLIDMPKVIKHKLTHRILNIQIFDIQLKKEQDLNAFLKNNKDFIVLDAISYHQKSFPKPLQMYIESFFESY